MNQKKNTKQTSAKTKDSASHAQKKRSGARTPRPWKSKAGSALFSAFLALVLVAEAAVVWALFVSGPARIHEEQTEKVMEAIENEVPGIEGLRENRFDYVTWQGYTDSTLYWFDGNGTLITSRPMETLDYQEARNKASAQYGVDAQTVTLAYGYSAPVYELQSDTVILMLDYDTLEWVYEREL